MARETARLMPKPTGEAIGIDPFRDTPLVAQTPSGSLHFYFRHDPRSPLKGGRIAPGVKVRADGDFVVLPPSRPSIEGRGLPGRGDR